MLKTARKTIEKYGMLSKGDKVGVAVSGGPDSVALLHVLVQIGGDYGLDLSILHLNHGIRGEESDNDEAFVDELAKSMGIPFMAKSVSIPDILEKKKGSLEEVSRKERYRFFEDVCLSEGLDKIALGHNLDDQAETVIMKFLRGSGLEGLRGMLPVRDDIYIRPLIDIAKGDIRSFLKNEGCEFVEDGTNKTNLYLRNRIRNILIPALRDDYNPNLVDNIGRMSHILRMEDDFMRKTVEEILSDWGISRNGDGAKINISKLNKLHEALRQRVVKVLLEETTSSKSGIGYRHVRSVMDLVEGENVSGVLSLPFNVIIRREYDYIILSRDEECRHSSGFKREGREASELAKAQDFSYPLQIPGNIDISEAHMTLAFRFIPPEEIDFGTEDAVFMDYDKMSPPLIIRNMREGDRIQPFGMEGTKKLKDLFVDRKIPRVKRSDIPLLVDQKGVVWLPKIQLSQRVKITDMTEKVVKAEII